jgi:mannose-6-phosphate isomerase-like protein (cupin superfamily)
MIGRWLRFTVLRGGEILLAVALVFAFFLVFMGLLSYTFPEGTSLADLMRSGEPIGHGVPRSTPQLDVALEEGGANTAIAVLSRVRRDVKDKPADAIAWSDSRPGLPLGNYHAVQTYERSRATISFTEAGEMTLDENSLVVLKQAEHLPSENRNRASLIVLDGTLRGHLVVGRSDSVTVEVQAATKAAHLVSAAAPGSEAEFSVTVNNNRSSTFSVLAGNAQIVSERGAIVIAPNQSVTVDEEGVLGPVVPLPPAPESIAPADASRVVCRSSRARVAFRWSAPEKTSGYLLNVARDPGFRDLVVSERLTEPALTLGDLRPGQYYWRVRSLQGDLSGPDGVTREFSIVQDRKPPLLSVNFANGLVRRQNIVLTGVTEPGTKVFIDGQKVSVGGNGRFTHTLSLKRGVNVVVVEAVDDTGNVAYRSRIINASY